eukprot:TRINITY_DN1429_c0_g2_i1.p1 TRINITY_DN1429_c0_g2~~TRINITY_DN1429_c0_g2_i1.p1  ORF type:complete len:1610 (+),score=383.56 TRINITY_DN1429_c0_g2_i1:65-4894(+)
MKGKWDTVTLKKLRGYNVEVCVGLTSDASVKHYNGDLDSDGKPDGSGIALFHNGTRYGGFWKAGKRSGRGFYDTSNDGSYDGEWENDQCHGQGKREYGDHSLYIGEWSHDLRHGTGTLSTKDFKFEGQWDNDKPFGQNVKYTSQNTLKKIAKGVTSLGNSPSFPTEFFSGERTSAPAVKQYEGNLDKELGMHGRGKIEYKNGNTYSGELSNNKREGKGKCTFDNGDRFEGTWLNDQRHGKGILMYANGGRYDGDWKNDMKEGVGTREYHNGDRYHGEWEGNHISGKGEQVYRNGDTYSGDWLRGKPNGYGTFKFPKQGAEYTGPTVNGLFHTGENPTSPGKMKYSSGAVFTGTFIKGERQKGVMWMNDNSVYSGELKFDKFHGKGLMWTSDGGFYYGKWERGERHGIGCLRDSDGTEYVGKWEGGKRHGHGTKQRPDNTIQHGLWEDDEPTTHYDGEHHGLTYHGEGYYKYANGSSYYGTWVQGHKSGFGQIKFKDKGIYEGDIVCDIPYGTGTLLYPNNSQYTGTWLEGTKHGQGTLFDADDNRYSGSWERDCRIGLGILFHSNYQIECLWADNKPSGTVTVHCTDDKPRRRSFISQYMNGLEVLSILHIHQQVPDSTSGQKCSFCQSSFGISRWKYSCPGCKQDACSSCLKEFKIPSGFCGFAEGSSLHRIESAGQLGNSLKEDSLSASQDSEPPSPVAAATRKDKACAGCSAAAVKGSTVISLTENGHYITGTVTAGQFNGSVKKISSDRDYYYVGSMVDSQESGHGNLITNKDTEYIGEFLGGLPSGKGFLRLPNGTVKEGFFEQGIGLKIIYHGEVKRTSHPDGLTATVTRHGVGKATNTDGSVYNGMHQNGLRHGIGLMANGVCNIYLGEWSNNLRNGVGKETTEHFIYTGLWKDDMKNGRGVRFDLESGVKYEGEWVNEVLEKVFIIRHPHHTVDVKIYEKGTEKRDLFTQPEMAPDESSSTCTDCKKPFTMLTRRRHHCRGCGQLFCKDCSNQTYTFPPHFNFSSPQRCCRNCKKLYSEGKSVRYYIDVAKGSVQVGVWVNESPHGPHLFKNRNTPEVAPTVTNFKNGVADNETSMTVKEFSSYFNQLCRVSNAPLTYPSPSLEDAAAKEVNEKVLMDNILADYVEFSDDPAASRNRHKNRVHNIAPVPKIPDIQTSKRDTEQRAVLMTDEELKKAVEEQKPKTENSARIPFTLKPIDKPSEEGCSDVAWTTWEPETAVGTVKHHLSPSSVSILSEKKEDSNPNKLLQVASAAVAAPVSVISSISSLAKSSKGESTPILPGPVLPFPLTSSVSLSSPVLSFDLQLSSIEWLNPSYGATSSSPPSTAVVSQPPKSLVQPEDGESTDLKDVNEPVEEESQQQQQQQQQQQHEDPSETAIRVPDDDTEIATRIPEGGDDTPVRVPEDGEEPARVPESGDDPVCVRESSGDEEQACAPEGDGKPACVPEGGDEPTCEEGGGDEPTREPEGSGDEPIRVQEGGDEELACEPEGGGDEPTRVPEGGDAPEDGDGEPEGGEPASVPDGGIVDEPICEDSGHTTDLVDVVGDADGVEGKPAEDTTEPEPKPEQSPQKEESDDTQPPAASNDDDTQPEATAASGDEPEQS